MRYIQYLKLLGCSWFRLWMFRVQGWVCVLSLGRRFWGFGKLWTFQATILKGSSSMEPRPYNKRKTTFGAWRRIGFRESCGCPS